MICLVTYILIKCIFYVLLLINNYVGEKKPFHPEAKTEITKNSRLPKGFSLFCLFFFTYVDNSCVVGGRGGNLKGGVVGGEWGSFSRVGGGEGRIGACYYVDP